MLARAAKDEIKKNKYTEVLKKNIDQWPRNGTVDPVSFWLHVLHEIAWCM